MPSMSVSCGPVLAGKTFVATVAQAACDPVTLTFKVNGQVVRTIAVPAPPGTYTFACPAGTTGQDWEVTASCPGGGSATASGTVG
jgi:hypothetical protein